MIDKDTFALVDFLNKLSIDLQKKNIENYEYNLIIELYIRMKMKENTTSQFDQNDMIKFITLGWYLSSMIENTQE